MITYQDAMDSYGTDRPDTRFDMNLVDLSDLMKDSSFRVFTTALEQGGVVKAIAVQGGASFSRKELDRLNDLVAEYGAKGLFWAKVGEEGWQSPVAKFMTPDITGAVQERMEVSEGDLG